MKWAWLSYEEYKVCFILALQRTHIHNIRILVSAATCTRDVAIHTHKHYYLSLVSTTLHYNLFYVHMLQTVSF